MSNLHGLPDTMGELMAREADLLAPAILASSLAVGSPSMTLPAFATYGYVRAGNPAQLKYVNQLAAAVTLSGSDGPYWLVLHWNTYSDVASWNRQRGTHYLWCSSATQPADPPGGLVLASVTVAGGVITAASSALNYPATRVAFGGPTGQLAFDSNLTWASSVLTVRNTVNARQCVVQDHAGDNAIAFSTNLASTGGTNRWALYAGGNAPSLLGGTLQVNGIVGLGVAPTPGTALDVNGAMRVRATGRFGGEVWHETHTSMSGTVGAGGAFDTRFSLRSYGTSFFDGPVGVGIVPAYALDVGGTVRLGALVGIGRAPDASYSLVTIGPIYSGGALYAAGATTLYGSLLVTLGAFLASTLTVSGHTVLATAGTTGNLTCAATFGTQSLQTGAEVGLMRAPVAGWALSVGGAIQSNNAIANKLGAGPWGESSSRRLKRHIEDIPDALTVLLAQRGRRYEWEEPERAAAMPGPQHGFVFDEVSIPQWRDTTPDGAEILTMRGFEALCVESLRTIVRRLEALEGAT